MNYQNLIKKTYRSKLMQSSQFLILPSIASESVEVGQFSQRLLWVHQEDWQQKLCVKYGNTISLIDATYKTTKYDLPLFLYVSVQMLDTA